jgi:hypothetical protein
MRASLLALGLLCPSIYAADADYFPADTKVVIGLQVKGMVDAIVRNFGSEPLKAGVTFTESTPFAGFDPAKDLDEVLIATSGKGDTPPALMVLRGHFDPAKLKVKPQAYHGVPVVTDPQKPGQVLALLEGGTALAGDAGLVHAAIDHKNNGASWTARIDPLRAKYVVWGIGDGIEGTPGDQMKSLDRFEFGAGFEHGIDLTAAAHFRAPEDAEALSMLLKLMQAAPQTGGAKIDIETAGGTMRVSLRMSEEELKKAIESQKEALAAAVMSQLGTKPPVPKDPKIVTNSQGDTTSVTLPGKK